MTDELGWADFAARSDRAIRRHWTLECCAFALCWWHKTYRARVVDASTKMLALPPPEKAPIRREENLTAARSPSLSTLAQGPMRSASLAKQVRKSLLK